MTTESAIEISNLRKEYDGEVAIDSLSLQVEKGTVYGFLGPNGAGKTTTMRIMTTLKKPTSGSARVAGHSITDPNAVKSSIGFLPEKPPLYDELSGREQLEFWAELREVPKEAVENRIETLLDQLSLLEDADKRIGTYSKGMRQKVGVAQSLLHEPEVLFLDEPTSGLDPHAVRTVRNLLSSLADQGTTIFLSTHILSVVDTIADTVGVLHDGRLVAEASPDELKKRVKKPGENTLEDAFVEITTEQPVDTPV